MKIELILIIVLFYIILGKKICREADSKNYSESGGNISQNFSKNLLKFSTRGKAAKLAHSIFKKIITLNKMKIVVACAFLYNMYLIKKIIII